MPDWTLTAAERTFLAELARLGVRFMVVGMSGALIQGARGATEDIDLMVRGRHRRAHCRRGARVRWASGSPVHSGWDRPVSEEKPLASDSTW